MALTEDPTGRTRRATMEPAAAFYSIPSHWLWVNIGDVGHDWGQTKPSGDFTYIDVSAIDNQRGVVSEGASIVSAVNAPSRARKVVKKGTVIYSTVRPYLLNIAIIERDFDPSPIASTAFAILHPHNGVEAKFVYYFLRSPAFVAYVEGVQSGIAYPAISDHKFFAASFPLAPTEEQQRIVAKVDDLMALCDRLEAQQQERERCFPVLSRTCHARFAEIPTSSNLNRIFDDTGTVAPADLRNTILTLAVQGKLLPQDPMDESADACLARLGIESTFKAEASEASLPRSWSKVRFEDVAIVSGGVTLGRNLVGRKIVTLPYLRVANVKRAEIDLAVVKEVAIPEEEIDRFALRENDLLMTEGGDWDKVGRAAIWKGQIPLCLHQNHVFRSRFRSTEIMPVWFERYFNSPVGRSYFESASKQTTNLASINMRQVRGCPIPFPPLAEQRRIVAKVNELTTLVAQLEAQLQERDKLAEAFAKACIASFTGTTQPEKMNAPKTELVSLVTLGKIPKSGANAPLALLLSQHNGALPAKSLWQQSGLTIDVFYQQLKSEIANGWITPPLAAKMKVLEEA